MGVLNRFLDCGFDLRRSEQGAVAPIFAVSALAVFVILGASLDYNRIEKARAQLQSSTDATAISLAIQRANGLKDEQLSDAATKRLRASVPPDLQEGIRSVGAEGLGSKVSVRSLAAVPLGFAGILGKSEVVVEAQSKADFGSAGATNKVEVALVVGLTGGVNEKGRLEALKRQTQAFTDKAREAAEGKDTIKLALVPYAEHVKLKPVYRPAPWLSFAGNEEKPTLTGEQQSKASSERMAAFKLALKSHQLKIERMAWTGCVTDTKDPTIIAFDAANQHPGVICASNEWHSAQGNVIEPLTARHDQIRQQAGQMVAEGCENTTLGLVWGMGALLPQGPFGTAAPANDAETRKVLILVSSAPNQVNRLNGICIAPGQREPKLNHATATVCDRIKRQGVTIYAVNLIDGDPEVLKACASDLTKYHHANSAGDLQRVMDEVAKEVLVQAPKMARLVN
ncbi:MAG TPA: Tad domain-containing protein [Beijerinckiaceae bacterium]|nr:Tad domain-containing protein [Beijerinckiaceae bacterium]